MDIYSIRILSGQPLRLGLTIGGIALCIVLMLFLLSIYQGVEEGSVEYIRKNPADLWVLQRNAWNILRGSSFLSSGHGIILQSIPSVQSASPILLLLSGIKKEDRIATVFLTGYEPDEPLGGPPYIVTGRSVRSDDEIVLDYSFCQETELLCE